jgi:hypothetical protein
MYAKQYAPIEDRREKREERREDWKKAKYALMTDD